MGRKSRTNLKINAEMAAEDAYRWQWCFDNGIEPEKMCYWFIYTKSGNIPGGKETDCKFKRRYDAHMKLLNETFGQEETSLFELKMTDNMGLGVFARKKLQIVLTDSDSDSDILTTKLQAKYHNVIENIDWSIGKVTTHNNLGGRPIVGQKRSSSEIKEMMKDGIKKSLVGPFNFLNHACDAHSQFNLVEDVEEQCVYANPKTNIHVKKGDQIFINYQEGGIIDYADVDYECASCK